MENEKNYWFTSDDGEDFFVTAFDARQAKAIAREYFGTAKCHGVVSEEWAEMQGWDTY